MNEEEINELIADSNRILAKRVFQPGEAEREPKNDRERAAIARWIEIDLRRAEARATGKDFHYTDAERQLKRRLLRAGLIITKEQPKQSRREARLEKADATIIFNAFDTERMRRKAEEWKDRSVKPTLKCNIVNCH